MIRNKKSTGLFRKQENSALNCDSKFVGRSNDLEDSLRRKSVRALGNPGNSRDDALTIKNFPYNNEARIGSDENGSDFYKIKQTKDKQIKFNIYVENDEGIFGPSLTFALQNKNGKTLASDKVGGNDDDEIEKKLGKGTYYIKVSTDGESVPYDIEVTKG